AEAAARLLADDLSPFVRERLLAAAQGNPLALETFAAAMTADQLAGRESLPDPLPITRAVEARLLARLGAAERKLLLASAVADGPAPHPLVRSAVSQPGTAAARREAHALVADTLAAAGADDRAVRHRAAAATGPDERLASELERTADRARRRSGYGAAAAAL